MLTGAELALLYGDQARKELVGSGKGGFVGQARALKKTIEQYNKDTEKAKTADQKAFLKVQKKKKSENEKALKEQKKKQIAAEKALKQQKRKNEKQENAAKIAHQQELNDKAKQRQAQIAQREKNMEQNIKNKMLGMGADVKDVNKALQERRNQRQLKSDLTKTVMTGKGTGKFAPVSPQPTQISQGAPKVSGPTVNPLSPKVKGQITKTANKQTPKPSGTTITPIPKPASPVIKTPGSPTKIPSKSEMDDPIVKKLMS